MTISTFGFNQTSVTDDITIVVDFDFRYRPYLALWSVRKQIRMISILDKDGKIKWVPHPIDDLERLRGNRFVVHGIPISVKAIEKSLQPSDSAVQPGKREHAFSTETGTETHPPTRLSPK